MGDVAAAAGLALADSQKPARASRFTFAAVPLNEIAAVVPRWSDLADRSTGDNAFFHPDFAVPAIRHLGEGDVGVAIVAAGDGSLVAAAPFTRARLGRIAPAVRLWSHPYGPFGAPLVDRDLVEPAVATLVEGLAPEGSRLSLIVPDLPSEGRIAMSLRRFAMSSGRPLAILDEHRRAMLERTGPGEVDLRSELPLRRRKELSRQMRRLDNLGPVVVETAVQPDCVRARFEEFLSLEVAGWKGRRGTALTSTVATAEFAREVVFNRSAVGAVRMDSIRVGGHRIAILTSLVAGETAFTWKIAYDEAYGRLSPGVQLMLEAPRSLFSDPNLKRIDSLAAADHPMIDRLWPGRLAIATFVLEPPGGGVLHRLGVAAARAEGMARANMRHLRGRLA